MDRNLLTCDIIRDTMNLKRLTKLKRELDALSRGQAKAGELESLAIRLGRKQVKRGKEPVWESEAFPILFPLSIPHHGGRDIPVGTRRSILRQLLEDIEAWEFALTGQRENESDDETE